MHCIYTSPLRKKNMLNIEKSVVFSLNKSQTTISTCMRSRLILCHEHKRRNMNIRIMLNVILGLKQGRNQTFLPKAMAQV